MTAHLTAAIRIGVVAGLAGGLTFGAAMARRGTLRNVAALVGSDSELVGFGIHMTIAAMVGAGLGLLLQRGRWSAADTVFWGATYATFFWFLGPLTIGPLIMGQAPAWTIDAVRGAFPSLLGHVLWGTTAGLTLVAIETSETLRHGIGRGDARHLVGPIVRGLLAGLLAFWLVGLIPGGGDRMLSPAVQTGIGAVAGVAPFGLALALAVIYALLHGRSTGSAGSALVRGAGFGFLLWVIGGLTVLPSLRGESLPWGLDAAHAAFPALMSSVLYGGAMGLLYHWLDVVHRVLLSDEVREPGPGGGWGLGAVARGTVAGLVGGGLFTLIMLQIGFLPSVARLVGSSSVVTGFIVHIAIAEIIGVTYALLFRRQAVDVGSALGWGVSYGLVWWVIGPITLVPVILGQMPAWTVEAATNAFPSLIGHIVYGAGLGITFQRLEARHSPWWITRTEAEAGRMVRWRDEAHSAGPALWALLLVAALVIPTILAR